MRCVLFVFLDISVSYVICKGTAASWAYGRQDSLVYSSVLMSIYLSFNELADFIVFMTSRCGSLVPVKLCFSFH